MSIISPISSFLHVPTLNLYQAELGAGSGLLQKPVLDVAVRFQADHKAHRDALIATIQKLGGTPVMEKKLDEYAKALKADTLRNQGDVLDLAVAQNVVDKSGAWFSYKGDRLGQGRENSKATLKEKPEILKRIEREVKVKLGMAVREEKVEAAQPSAKAATSDKK